MMLIVQASLTNVICKRNMCILQATGVLIAGKPFQSMAGRFRDHLTVPIFVDMLRALLALVVVPGKPSHASIIIVGKRSALFHSTTVRYCGVLHLDNLRAFSK
jgi:hypothetical protein